MRHDPSNSQCDKNQYGDAPDVRCTCDIDDPEDAPAPSTVVTPDPRPPFGAVLAAPGSVVLQGRAASTHSELKVAGQRYQAAQLAYEKAKYEYQQALDAHMKELLA